jgi:hypothetical protein
MVVGIRVIHLHERFWSLDWIGNCLIPLATCCVGFLLWLCLFTLFFCARFVELAQGFTKCKRFINKNEIISNWIWRKKRKCTTWAKPQRLSLWLNQSELDAKVIRVQSEVCLTSPTCSATEESDHIIRPTNVNDASGPISHRSNLRGVWNSQHAHTLVTRAMSEQLLPAWTTFNSNFDQ